MIPDAAAQLAWIEEVLTFVGLRSLIDAGTQVHSFEPLLAPMEDVFLRVVTEAGHEPLA